MLTAALAMLFLGSAPLFAQKPHGGGAGGGNSGATGAAMHGASGEHGNGGGSANGNASTKSATASSPTTVLANNTKLDTHLTSLLQSKGLLPKGTDLKDACAGFKNLGQCVAAIHVSHNLNIPFACLSADMTGTAPAAGVKCPTGTGTSPTGTGTSKMSLGKSIQTLSPNSTAKTEAKTATKQAADDINEAENSSKSST